MDNETEFEKWIDCWKKPVKVQYRKITKTEEIETREGKLYGYADKDVLLKGIKGEVYPCKIDIFEATYTTNKPESREEIEQATRQNCHCKNHKDYIETLHLGEERGRNEQRHADVELLKKLQAKKRMLGFGKIRFVVDDTLTEAIALLEKGG